VKKWHIVLGVIAVILVVAIFFLTRITTMYSTQVVAVEAGSSLGIAPYTDRVDFGDIPQGGSISKTIILENNGDNNNTIKLYILGSISQLIEPKQGYSFEVKAGQTMDLDLQLTMPASAPVGKKFSGRIIILRLP
jgi:hypothetical protein